LARPDCTLEPRLHSGAGGVASLQAFLSEDTMRIAFPVLLAALAAPLSAPAAVTVDFTDPQGYRDASFDGDYRVDADEPALRGIGNHLQKLGARYLPPDQSLKVEVLDVDLAGRLMPWQPRFYGTRLMDEVTWPAIRMRYTLERDGAVVMSAEESVIDQLYLGRPREYFSSDRLVFEKQMLDDWFRARFVEHRPPR
jgi:hypothetical protein